DSSRARLEIIAADDDALSSLLGELQAHGANRVTVADAELVPCTTDGVLPSGFYATTNLPTQVRIEGGWIDVENPEMDCALVVSGSGAVRSVPMHRLRMGERVVVGNDGVRVQPLERPRGASPFEFMA